MVDTKDMKTEVGSVELKYKLDNIMNEFITKMELEISQKEQAIKNWKSNNPDAPHEYEILNTAWVKGERNLLNKLKEHLAQ